MLGHHFFEGQNYGPASFLVRLPRDENGRPPPDKSGYCIGTMVMSAPVRRNVTKVTYNKKNQRVVVV